LQFRRGEYVRIRLEAVAALLDLTIIGKRKGRPAEQQ
jgi:hypothetical protein